MQRLFKVTVNGKEFDIGVLELTMGAALMPNYLATPTAAPMARSVAPVAASPVTATVAPAVVAAPVTIPSSGIDKNQYVPMGGIVSKIYVQEGQQVNEGDRIAELTAMKMEVPVIATNSGIVTKIMFSEGDAIISGQALMSLA